MLEGDEARANREHPFSRILADAEFHGAPFPYFVANSVLREGDAAELRDFLRSIDRWTLNEGSFFEQYEADLAHQPFPSTCRRLVGVEAIAQVRASLEDAFDCALEDRAKVIAHMMTPGQGIGIHNDDPLDGDETHRFVFYLGDEFADADGGHLLLFNRPHADHIHRVVRPTHNSGFGFAMSSRSFHAVSEIRSGIRFSLVFSFWEAAADKPRLAKEGRPEREFIRVPSTAGADRETARQVAFELFPMRYPVEVTADADGCTFALEPSQSPGVLRDSQLPEQLAATVGASLSERGAYRVLRCFEDDRLYLRTLDHQWALWAWSKWIRRTGWRGPLHLLHLDAHDDLASPPLACTDSPAKFSLPLSGSVLDTADPSTVAQAILRGRIGVGSFIAPLIGGPNRIDILHAVPAEVERHVVAVSRGEEPFTSGLPGMKPRVDRDPLVADDRASTYTIGSVADIATLEVVAPVLLDIDMDFFSNRVGADDPDAQVDEGLQGVLSRIEQVGGCLASNQALQENVAVVTVALSPGFFPSEYWSAALPAVENAIARALHPFASLGTRR
ncbi:cyclophane-containing peptide 2OG-Fe(II) oxygenase YhhC [Microbacterium sp. NPDC019599]|uniref:cyclophane-containing peptide 2OG-Fe(II) oxygenase YhhC n=1 Tax=Microbacterium sp. NPDC019599 TaxID=3154690 RepID=UPI0033EFD1B9